MKRAAAIVAMGFLGMLCCGDASAATLHKDALAIKEAFDKAGATNCAQAMAETVDFLAKGRHLSHQRRWSTSEPNAKPITVDFLIGGNSNTFGVSGAVFLVPMGNKCVGNYTYSFVAPSANCKTYMQTAGFESADWHEDMNASNGDGGTAYFMSVKNIDGLSFILNDVAGGCEVAKRETVILEPRQ